MVFVMKIKMFVYLFFVAVVAVLSYGKNDSTADELLLANVEALTYSEGGDHGEIDKTLESYWELSSKEIWIGDMKYPTVIPCCKPSDSEFSGCAKGLDRC